MGAHRLKGKKVLVVGLGSLGGGIATVKWFLGVGARVTVTDDLDADRLAASVKRVEEHCKRIARDGKDYERIRGRLTWSLGESSSNLVAGSDLVVVNPAVSSGHPLAREAEEQRIPILNEGTIFFDAHEGKTIGITGTRGKTTTASWAHHLIAKSVLAGSSPTRPFLGSLPDRGRPVVVAELSSFLLERFLPIRPPHIAAITNLSRDHLDRHGSMEQYALTKAAVFAQQSSQDHLILAYDDAWTPWFLEQSPKAMVHMTSCKTLPREVRGVWYTEGVVWHRSTPAAEPVAVLQLPDFVATRGEHNMRNLLAAALAAHLSGVSWKDIAGRIATLPDIPYRQEVVHRDRSLTVVNDTAATSPDGGIAALQRWGGPNCLLIAGGTDRDLDYQAWGQAWRKHMTRNNTFFLTGTATKKMRAVLGKDGRGIRSYETLAGAWRAAQRRSGAFIASVILFSPAAKSFELFANQFDRGQQFNSLVLRSLRAK